MKKSTSKTVAGRGASHDSARGTRDSFDLETLKAYAEFMKAQGLSELDIRSGDRQVHLRRGEALAAPVSMAAPVMAAAAPAAAPAVEAAAPAPARKYHVVTSPFVGTFYRSPGPNQESFVEEGQIVNPGDALCIVEAMKLMNEIEADTKGRIVRILVNNATPVEFGEALFEIDPV